MLGEMQARRIYFMRALDELDEDGIISLPFPTVKASGQAEDVLLDQLMRAREEQLADLAECPIQPFYRPVGARVAWLLPLCFFLGLGANYLGTSTQVDLFANPLVTLILWNLVVFGLLVVRVLLGRKGPPALPAFLHRVGARWLGPSVAPAKGLIGLLRRARPAATLRWYREQMPLALARITYLLHLAATFLMGGAITGLYIRGLARAYRFQWDSTFIHDKQAFLEVVFALPLWLRGGGLPVAPDNGAGWINLLAISGVCYVILPRLLLAAYWAWRARRMAAAVDVGVRGRYFQKLLTAKASLEPHLSLLGYGYKLTRERVDQLMAVARELWGERVRLHETVNIGWGETDLELQPASGVKQIYIVFFNGAQTPEEEVHLPFGKNLKRAMLLQRETLFLVVIDGSRVDEAQTPRRKRAWLAVLAEAGIEGACWLDFSAEDAGEVLARFWQEQI